MRYWDAAFHSGLGPEGLPLLAVRKYQRLYDPGFPARWRHRVLATVAGRTGLHGGTHRRDQLGRRHCRDL